MSWQHDEVDSAIVGVLLVLVLAVIIYLASLGLHVETPATVPVDVPVTPIPNFGVRRPWFHPFRRGI